MFNDEYVTKINGLGDKIPQNQNQKESAEEDERWLIRNIVIIVAYCVLLGQMFGRNAQMQENGDESKIVTMGGTRLSE